MVVYKFKEPREVKKNSLRITFYIADKNISALPKRVLTDERRWQRRNIPGKEV